jgi:hypothetical protein
MMTPKQQAFRNTFKLILTGMLGGALCAFAFSFFTLYQIGITITVILSAYMVRFVYLTELDRAERLEKLNRSKG